METQANKVLAEVMTTTEAAQAFGYTVRHVRLLCDMGKLQARKSGREWLIYVPSLRAYLIGYRP